MDQAAEVRVVRGFCPGEDGGDPRAGIYSPTHAGSLVCRGCGFPAGDHPLVEIQEDGVVLRLVDVDGDDDTDDGRELNEDEDGVEEDEDAARGPGQPRIEIDLADIVELRNDNFRWADIARMTGLNPRTLRRWRERVNFSTSQRGTSQ